MSVKFWLKCLYSLWPILNMLFPSKACIACYFLSFSNLEVSSWCSSYRNSRWKPPTQNSQNLLPVIYITAFAIYIHWSKILSWVKCNYPSLFVQPKLKIFIMKIFYLGSSVFYPFYSWLNSSLSVILSINHMETLENSTFPTQVSWRMSCWEIRSQGSRSLFVSRHSFASVGSFANLLCFQ